MLKDLGVTSIDEINEEDSELLDAQIQSLLDEDNENLGGIEDSLMKLAEFNESAIDDDDDEEEGNENSQADLDRLEKTMEHDAIDDEIKAIDSNLTLLDDEISKLTPLINDTNQGLLEEKETKRNNWKKKNERNNYNNYNTRIHWRNFLVDQHHLWANQHRYNHQLHLQYIVVSMD